MQSRQRLSCSKLSIHSHEDMVSYVLNPVHDPVELAGSGMPPLTRLCAIHPHNSAYNDAHLMMTYCSHEACACYALWTCTKTRQYVAS